MVMQSPDESVHIPVEPQEMDQIENLFTYHVPTDHQKELYLEIRTTAKQLARVIDAACPEGPDRTAAMRKLRECTMTANASIATNGGH